MNSTRDLNMLADTSNPRKLDPRIQSFPGFSPSPFSSPQAGSPTYIPYNSKVCPCDWTAWGLLMILRAKDLQDLEFDIAIKSTTCSYYKA